MLLDEEPQVVRERRTAPEEAAAAADEALTAARALHARRVGCTGWAVHASRDGLRVVTLESWTDEGAYFRWGHLGGVPDRRPAAALYRHVATTGRAPTPVDDPDAGVIVIDTFHVARPFTRPISAFTVRNGRAFARAAGCLSTTVLRSTASGRIATYARWRRTEDFLAAFTAAVGVPVGSLDEINRAAAARTRGLVRPDYHAYELVGADEGVRS